MIKFKSIRWKNFLSTGAQFTEVKLNHSSTTLIVGENGAGKSTILDALCFVLFNKPFRNINKPQLMNTVNGKGLEVEIEFSIGKKDYKVVRASKPNKFEILVNGTLVNQDAAVRDYQKYLEESILKLNYKSFTQIVILGSASFTPFMQLSLGIRREIIEDILDIQIFTVMNTLLKDKITENKNLITDLETKLEVEKQKIKIQQDYVKTLEADKTKKVNDVANIITNTNLEVSEYQVKSDFLQIDINNLSDKINDEKDSENKHQKLNQLLHRLNVKITDINKEIEFYSDHDNCPTCSQAITEEIKTDHISKYNNKIEELNAAIEDLVKQINDVQTRLNDISEIKRDIGLLQDELIKTKQNIIACQNYIQKLQNDIEEANQNVGNITEEKNKLKSLAKDAMSLAEKKSVYTEEKHYLDIAGILLRDTGIKTKIIKQYLPVINKLVNKYLAAMDFFCHFELDETFNEVIKSRHRDEFSYASFSEGEKQRIDLALLFTWRTIAKMKNSTSTNLLLLDEVFDSSLDANGTDYVMGLLNTLGEETNVFVISHKGDLLFDKFRSVIKFEKVQNFSRISK
jgi:DNA repair exonuclease SbcCD ATPase subunit